MPLNDFFKVLANPRQLSSGLYYKRTDVPYEPPRTVPGITPVLTNHNWEEMRARRIGVNTYEVTVIKKHHQHGYVALRSGVHPLVGTVSEDKKVLPDQLSLAEVANLFFAFHHEKSEQNYHVAKRRFANYYAKAERRGWTPPQKQQAELKAA